jgi:membrane protein implicated in regulation of membrane protease activity
VKRRRDLIVTNVAAVAVLLVALLLGWWEAAAFGLAVLVFMDVMALLRERMAQSDRDSEET